jgi:hypothetical protein
VFIRLADGLDGPAGDYVRLHAIDGGALDILSQTPSRLVVRAVRPGCYRFAAVDERGTPVSLAVAFTAVERNRPPRARASVRCLPDGLVVLDASGSSDPEGSPLTYRWESAGGSARRTLAASSREPFARLEFDDPGRREVVLVVSDGERVVRAEPIGFSPRVAGSEKRTRKRGRD